MHQGIISCINQHERHINLQQQQRIEWNDQFFFLDPIDLRFKFTTRHLFEAKGRGSQLGLLNRWDKDAWYSLAVGWVTSATVITTWQQVCAGVKLPVSSGTEEERGVLSGIHCQNTSDWSPQCFKLVTPFRKMTLPKVMCLLWEKKMKCTPLQTKETF